MSEKWIEEVKKKAVFYTEIIGSDSSEPRILPTVSVVMKPNAKYGFVIFEIKE